MIDRVLGFLFGVIRGYILIVVPYMFYEAFFPDPNTHFPWVREAKSLPYIKATGDTLRGSLESHLPSSLTEHPGDQAAPPPPQEEQQAP
jgi:membrane protein required for colicin V production